MRASPKLLSDDGASCKYIGYTPNSTADRSRPSKDHAELLNRPVTTSGSRYYLWYCGVPLRGTYAVQYHRQYRIVLSVSQIVSDSIYWYYLILCSTSSGYWCCAVPQIVSDFMFYTPRRVTQQTGDPLRDFASQFNYFLPFLPPLPPPFPALPPPPSHIPPPSSSPCAQSIAALPRVSVLAIVWQTETYISNCTIYI